MNPKLRQFAFVSPAATTATYVVKDSAGTFYELFTGLAIGNENPLNARVTLYDNAASATGAVITSQEIVGSFTFNHEIDFSNGLVLKISPSGPVSYGSITVVFS